MPAYIVYAVTITDPAKYGEYVKHTPRVIAAYGGRMIVRGGDPEAVEGTSPGARIVIIEFPDRAAAKRFFTSPDYAPVKAIRAGAGEAHGIIVDGYAAEAWDAALTESRKLG